MMTLESAIEKTQTALYHYERLMDAFGHHPEQWEWTGDIAEGDPTKDHCACGHNIKWLFPWRHKDGSPGLVITGSVCVENVPGISPGTVERMKARIKEMEERRKEDVKKARAASEKAEVVAAEAEYEEARQAVFGRALLQLKQRRERGATGWMDPELYSEASAIRWYNEKHAAARNLKSANGQAKRIRGLAAMLRKLLYEGHPLRARYGGKRRHAQSARRSLR
jgi:hypothetical protein